MVAQKNKINGETIGFDVYLSERLLDREVVGYSLVMGLLESVPKILGLKPIGGSMGIFAIPVDDTGLVGHTGMIGLLESHCCVHTWPEKQYIRIEVSSCKRIDAKDIKRLIDCLTVSFKCEVVIKVANMLWQ